MPAKKYQKPTKRQIIRRELWIKYNLGQTPCVQIETLFRSINGRQPENSEYEIAVRLFLERREILNKFEYNKANLCYVISLFKKQYGRNPKIEEYEDMLREYKEHHQRPKELIKRKMYRHRLNPNGQTEATPERLAKIERLREQISEGTYDWESSIEGLAEKWSNAYFSEGYQRTIE